MKKSLSDHPIVVIISVLAAVCTIATFIILICDETNRKPTGGVSSELTSETISGQTDGTISEPPIPYSLDASIVHYPNLLENDLVVGGTWKLQNIHKDATSFTQSVRVYYNDDPQMEWAGNAKYGTCWSQDDVDPGNWSEPLMEVDKLAEYDYPEGTFGTFSVDLTGTIDILPGAYTCELEVVINQKPYKISLPFTVE